MGMRNRLASLVNHAPDDRDAICFGDQWWNWAQVRSVAQRVQSILDDAGLGEGARVGIALHNRPQYMTIVLAVLASGRCVTTLSPLQPEERLAADIERSTLPIVFGSAEALNKPAVVDAIRRTGDVVFVGDDGTLDGTVAKREWDESAFSPGIAVEILTSGTTGPPKRVRLTDHQFDSAFGSPPQREGYDDENPYLSSGVSIVNAPLVHIGGLWIAVNTMFAGRRLVLLDRFRVPDWVDAVRTHRPRVASVVPAALQALLDADVDPEALSSLDAVTSGTAPCPPELAEAFRDKYGIPVLTTYGATEFAGAVAAWSLADYKEWGDKKRGSVGRAYRGIEIRAVDTETGQTLPAGEVGTLEVKAAQLGGEGWTRTSDLGKVDADGFVFITGRSDDAIIRGGFKVHRGSIQKAIEQHPLVKAAAVVSKPHERLGAVPVAAVELVDGASLTEDELMAFCREQLIPYEVPAELKIVDALPRTPALKVSVVDVAELFSDANVSGK